MRTRRLLAARTSTRRAAMSASCFAANAKARARTAETSCRRPAQDSSSRAMPSTMGARCPAILPATTAKSTEPLREHNICVCEAEAPTWVPESRQSSTNELKDELEGARGGKSKVACLARDAGFGERHVDALRGRDRGGTVGNPAEEVQLSDDAAGGGTNEASRSGLGGIACQRATDVGQDVEERSCEPLHIVGIEPAEMVTQSTSKSCSEG
mmetsp:Transcript_53258/g.173169  ORF Transcript_53258/g.173169 Transcript_53258/m.173169 type:complete len:212 (-) Transcript_53258:103-738(-)